MRASDLFQLSLMGLRENRVRSGLTALGVVVGVFALTTIIALGEGLEASIKEQLTDDESRTRIIVRPGFGPRPDADLEVVGVSDPEKLDRLRKAMAKRRRGGPAQMRRKLLTRDAIATIETRTHVVAVRPLAIDRFAIAFKTEHQLDGALSYGVPSSDERWAARVIAGSPIERGARAVWLHEYLLYTWGYRTDAEQAALVGETVTLSRPRESGGVGAWLAAARANGLDLPVDEQQAEGMVRLFAQRLGLGGGVADGAELAVSLPIGGVIRERVEEDGFEVWEDSFSMQADVFLPQELAEELFEQVPSNVTRGYNAAAIEVDGPEHVREVERALRAEGYSTVSIDTILERVEMTVAIITAMVSGLTAIALIVAMLGIVNTMVMNVSERTREIGVLKALGATDAQIRWLFIFESALIGLVGGVIGTGLALLAQFPGDAMAQQAIVEVSQYRYDGSIFRYPAWLLGLGMLFAVGLSVLAAVGPSGRASRVDPVVALRDE